MPKIQTAELNWVLFKTGKIVQTSGFILLFLFAVPVVCLSEISSILNASMGKVSLNCDRELRFLCAYQSRTTRRYTHRRLCRNFPQGEHYKPVRPAYP